MTTQPTLEHLRDARYRWAHFDTIDATQASLDVREMQMLFADLGAVDWALYAAAILRIRTFEVVSATSTAVDVHGGVK